MIELRVCIDVDDLDKAIAFYTTALPLRLGRRLGPGVAELIGASSPIDLLAKPSGSAACAGARGRRDYARHWTPIHLDFTVPDAEAAVERARAAGAVVEREIETHVWGRIAQLADPFGHGFCVIEPRGRGYDELVTPAG